MAKRSRPAHNATSKHLKKRDISNAQAQKSLQNPQPDAYVYRVPFEVLVAIFSLLPVPQLIICRVVCQLWKSILEEHPAVWRDARAAFRLPIPAPPANLLEWRYATLIFGERKCQACGVLTNNLPQSVVNRIILCSQTCAQVFLRTLCRHANSASPNGDAAGLVPIEGDMRVTLAVPPLYYGGMSQDYDWVPLFVASHLDRGSAPFSVASAPRPNLNEAKKVGEKFVQWSEAFEKMRSMVADTNRKIIRNWFGETGHRAPLKIALFVPRVLKLEKSLADSLILLDTPATRKLCQLMLPDVRLYIKTRKTLEFEFGPRKDGTAAPALSCAHSGCEEKARTLAELERHLLDRHSIRFYKRSDIKIVE